MADGNAVPSANAEELVERAVEVLEDAQLRQERFQRLYRMCQDLAQEAQVQNTEGKTTEEFVFGIAEDILNAESLSDIFDAQDASGIAGKDFVGKPFELKDGGLRFMESSYRDPKALPFYAQMDVVEIETGEDVTIQCGGLSIVSVLYALRERDLLKEQKAFVLQAHNTASGNTRLSIRPYKRRKSAA